MAIGIRSWALARTPHSEQPTKSAVVSTVITTSSGSSTTSRTRKPSSPSSLGQGRYRRSSSRQGSSRCSLRTAATMAGAPDRVRGPSGQLPQLSAPRWNAKSLVCRVILPRPLAAGPAPIASRHHVTTQTKAAGTNVVNPWRYAGQYQDISTGLYKMGARYYQPELGRWTQRDPSGRRRTPMSTSKATR
jgi:RHS repeat-associated protein